MSHPAGAEHAEPASKLFIWVWIWLLLLTAVEVVLGYEQYPVKLMLTMLMSLSVIKAALIMAYFMHLRFEKLKLVLTLVPALVVILCLFSIFFFPDSLRLMNLGWGR
ncbi:MAG: cytochrome C oxidase subunit IV family protein [Acidobacteriia bacterium]|nr:cytochrome C oxidase subunit IV family protein [Terriglobia bacterium]